MNLSSRVKQNVLAVGVEAEIPQPDASHKLLGLVKLTITAEDRIDELDAGILAEKGWLLAPEPLAHLKHGSLACLKELLEFIHEAFAGLDEVVDQMAVVL